MVYYGRLSKACLPCRKRRLLCDLRADGCSSCRRARLPCTGYRDTSAIRINDQTSAVRQKITRRGRLAPSDVQSLDLSLCYQAIEMFYYDHVFGDDKSHEFMAQYYSAIDKDEHLIQSINAVSLAYLTYQRHSESARTEARLHYIDALRLTRKAIRTPDLVKKDSTILSILLLDLYEKITSSEPQYSGSWGIHIKGALCLIQSRGRDHYQNLESLRMIMRVTTNILISCVASGEAVPRDVVALRDATTQFFPAPSEPMQRESHLMVQFARLQNRVKLSLLSNEETVRTAVHLEVQFASLSEELGSILRYEIVEAVEMSIHHYEAYHHVYPSENVGQLWNVIRLVRILLCEIVLAHCADLKPRKSVEDYARKTIHHLSRDICATVPQYICYSPSKRCEDRVTTTRLLLASSQDEQIVQSRKADANQYLPCYKLIFPIFVVAQSAAASMELREYVTRQLRFMADHHGIKNALAVTEILKLGEAVDPWKVYALLGSYAFVC